MIESLPRHRGVAREDAAKSSVISALYIAILILFVLRAVVGGSLLDLMMDYRADQGSMIEKLHPTIYAFAVIAIFALTSFRIALTTWEIAVIRAIGAFWACLGAMLAYVVVAGIGSSVGFLIDDYVAACFSALLFLFSAPRRRLIGRALLGTMVLSAAVAVVEYTFKIPLLPRPVDDLSFRPVGLTSHPLELGLWCAVGIPLVTLSGWSRCINALACLVLYAGLVVSGARTALLAGTVSALIVAIASVAPHSLPQRRLERRMLVAIAAVVVTPLMIGALWFAGMLDRFSDVNGLDSAEARVVVYRVFDYMSWSDILFGIGTQRLADIATGQLKLVAVESAIVIFVALFGLVGALLFVIGFVYYLAVLLRGARPAAVLAVFLFVGVALSNNALASKEPAVFTLISCIIAFRPPDPTEPIMSG